MKKIALYLLCCYPLMALAQLKSRQRTNFDFGWRFHLGDTPDANDQLHYPEVKQLGKTAPADIPLRHLLDSIYANNFNKKGLEGFRYSMASLKDTNWQDIQLPHDWAVTLPYDSNGNLTKGSKKIDSIPGTSIGWYRKSFFIPKEDKGKKISIAFEGIYRNSLFWINGKLLGRNVSGYLGVAYSLDSLLHYGATNTIVVRVDASHDEGWWYEGAGIYRHVWLYKTNAVHIIPDSIYIYSNMHDSNATVYVNTPLINETPYPIRVAIHSFVNETGGKKVAANTQIVTLLSHQEISVKQQLQVAEPHLWNISSPYLYTIKTTVKQNDIVLDEQTTKHGFRTIKWDSKNGLFVNGENVYLKGVCMHQDHAGVGTAIPDKLERYRLQQLKQMGVNAYRTSHNPHSPVLYDLCDEMGLLVMDEARHMGTDSESMNQLKRMVYRDRNHPSVFMWSIGNEEEKIQGTDTGREIAGAMQEVVHSLDSTRLVTVAMNGQWGTGFSKIIDVQGFNYFRIGDMDQFRQQFPNLPAIGTEEGSTHATRGVYTNDPEKGWVSNYLPILRSWSTTPEKWMQHYADKPWIAGAFIWTGMDYRGEPAYRKFPNVISSYGIMDINGFPKDHYYFYQAEWTSPPVLHLLPHWNWPDSIGKKINVWAYTNCDSVELFLNGKSFGLGVKKPYEHIEWNISYQPGTLSAIGYRNGKAVCESKRTTAGSAYTIKLVANKSRIKANNADLAVVNFYVVDKEGNIVPTANCKIDFLLQGNAKNTGTGNGDPTGLEPDKANYRSAFMGQGQILVRSTNRKGNIILTASGEGLRASSIHLLSF